MNRFNLRPAADAIGIAIVVEVIVVVVIFAGIAAMLTGVW